jgi:arylsulfatase A-like enzyme
VVCDALVELRDVGATLVDLAGATWDVEHRARSFAPCLDDPAATVRAEAVSEFGGELLLLDRAWKCAFAADGRPYLLIDRGADPQEQVNRVDDPACAGVLAGMQVRALRCLLVDQLQQPAPAVLLPAERTAEITVAGAATGAA